jgi:hypothetical protein
MPDMTGYDDARHLPKQAGVDFDQYLQQHQRTERDVDVEGSWPSQFRDGSTHGDQVDLKFAVGLLSQLHRKIAEIYLSISHPFHPICRYMYQI